MIPNEFTSAQLAVIADVTKETLASLTRPSAAFVGQLISDVLYNRYGQYSYEVAQKRIMHEEGLRLFREKTARLVSSIPQDKLMLPNNQILMTSLANVQNCADSETLRDMFANLVSAAFDSNYINIIHPSLPSLLGRMSPEDAVTFKYIYEHQPIRFVCISYELTQSDSKVDANEYEYNGHSIRFAYDVDSNYMCAWYFFELDDEMKERTRSRFFLSNMNLISEIMDYNISNEPSDIVLYFRKHANYSCSSIWGVYQLSTLGQMLAKVCI